MTNLWNRKNKNTSKNNTVEKLNNKQKHGKNVKWLLDNIKKLKEVFNSEKKKPENDTNMEKKNN
ncbi:hypothetical protein [Mycoplasmopsis cynos]|uniref:hypothetical protein n=1 Tax=Mycoplasmopsis cynos TaxID=171284 RepID=UPI0022074089|nr:hypothetical protein [Mycoplasmopsis cynos]UWV77551.1 hypothetical protein NW070_01175 [Mycoplasmopsis cynos]